MMIRFRLVDALLANDNFMDPKYDSTFSACLIKYLVISYGAQYNLARYLQRTYEIFYIIDLAHPGS